MNKLYKNNKKMYYKAFAGCMYKKVRILNILRKDMEYYKKQILCTGTSAKEKEELKNKIKDTREKIQNVIKEYDKRIEAYKSARQ